MIDIKRKIIEKRSKQAAAMIPRMAFNLKK